jgi:sec-independent protein translocase protein TatA
MVDLLAIFNLGTTELVIILLIILLLFGGKKLPELSRSVGQSMSELRKGMNDGKKQETTKKDNDAS